MSASGNSIESPAPSVPQSAVPARRAAGDVVGQVVARTLNALLGVGVTIALVRGLGPRGYGDWAALLAVISIVGYLTSLGLDEVAVRQAAMDRPRESTWMSALVSLQLMLSVPVTIAALVVTLLIAHSGPTRVAAVLLSFTCVFSALGSVRAVFQLRIRNRWTAGFELLNGLLWAIGVFAIAAAGAGIAAFAAVFLAASAIVNVAQVALARRQIPLRMRGGGRARVHLLKIGVPFAIASLLYLSYTQIDQVLVFALDGRRASGLYGAASKVFERALVIPGSILATMFPMIAAAYKEDIVRMRGLIQTAVEVLLVATLPIVGLVAVIGRPLMRLLFGAEFEAAGPALSVLMITFAISAFSYVAGDLVIVLRLQRRYIVYAAVGLIVNVGLNVLLIPRYGFMAAAWVCLFTELLVIVLALRAVFTTIDQRLRFGRVSRILGVSVAGAAAALIAREAGLPLVPIGAAWLVATAGAWLVLAPWPVAELRSLLSGRPG
ncbi:MAG TPA: flippase [Solirubrobacteraceae bacterium]|nr:flippase [Solirubrobacteraceae bacterium]